MARWLYPLLGLLGVFTVASTAWAACPQRLRVGFVDAAFPPMLMGSGPQLADPPGWSVTAVQATAHRLGCRVDPQRLPARRLEQQLETSQLDFGLFFGPTAERLRAARFPLDAAGQPDAALAPLFGHLVFYALAGSEHARPGAAWDGRGLAPGVRVGVVSRSTQEQYAVDRGWPLEQSQSFDNALQMLRARRFELLLSPRETMRPEHLAGEGRLVEVGPAVQQLPYFVVASPQLMAQHPDFVRRFWRDICVTVRRMVPDARPADCGVTPPF